jgi:Fe-S-cluster-containing dehydrogenase component
MSGQIEEVADVVQYSAEKCWDCLFCEQPFCRYYGRYFNYAEGEPETKKPEWCRIDRIKIEFRR